MSLRRQLSSFHFNSEIMAARKMIIDLENLQEFFNGYSEVCVFIIACIFISMYIYLYIYFLPLELIWAVN
jgi:hypothetical protein